MRLLYLSPGVRALGGAERSLAVLLRGLNSRGHRTFVEVFGDGDAVELFASTGSELIVRPARLDRARRHAPGASFALGCARSLPAAVHLASAVRDDARRIRADLVHSNGLRAHMLAPLLGRRQPLVWSLLDDTPRGLQRDVLNIASLATDSVIANSHFTAGQLTRRRADVIYDPVEAEPALDRAAARALLGLPPHRPVVALVAHLHPYKGHHVAIDALTRFDPAARPLLAVAGGAMYGASSERYERRLCQLVVDRKLEGDVRMMGAVSRIGDVYAAADLLVHPTVEPEAFGRVLVEAQLAGVPVVASDAGGPRELIANGRSGVLVPPGDASALATAIARVLADAELASTLAGEGLLSARRFSPEVHINGVEAVYRRVLAR